MVRCDALTRPTTWEDYTSLRPRTGRSQASETRWFVSSCVRRSAVGGGARRALQQQLLCFQNLAKYQRS